MDATPRDKKATATTRCTLQSEVSLKYVLLRPIRRRCKILRHHGAAGQWGEGPACTPEMGEHELPPFLLGSTGSALARARQKVIARITMMMSGRLCLLGGLVGWLSALCGFRRVFEIGGGEGGQSVSCSPRSYVGETY